MSFRAWNLALIAATALATAVGICTNTLVDPFSVFGSHALPYHVQQNQRFLKIEFLKRGHSRFNGYMLGSSRIGTTDPATVERYIPGSRFYNMTVQGGTLLDAVTFVKYFLKERYDVKYLYVQIDIDTILQSYDYPDPLLLYRKHPATTGEAAWRFYLRYALAFPRAEITRKVRWNLTEHTDWMGDDIAGSGRWYWPEDDGQIAVKLDATFHEPGRRSIRDQALSPNVAALHDLVTLCEANGIRLYTFIAPNHREVLDSYVVEDYLTAVRALSAVTDLWDFGAYNSVTTDDTLYYESSHYRPRVAELIAARIFHDASTIIPADFGAFLTAENRDLHLDALRAEFRAADDRRPQGAPQLQSSDDRAARGTSGAGVVGRDDTRDRQPF